MEVEMMRSLVLQFNNDAAANVLPDFTVKDLAGKHTQTILSGMGKLHSSNLWFVSCPPCNAEIPNLN